MAITLRCFASQNNRQHNKVVAYDIIEGSLNGERYANFLEDKLIPECNKPMHFLMDNVPFHKTHAVISCSQSEHEIMLVNGEAVDVT